MPLSPLCQVVFSSLYAQGCIVFAFFHYIFISLYFTFLYILLFAWLLPHFPLLILLYFIVFVSSLSYLHYLRHYLHYWLRLYFHDISFHLLSYFRYFARAIIYAAMIFTPLFHWCQVFISFWWRHLLQYIWFLISPLICSSSASHHILLHWAPAIFATCHYLLRATLMLYLYCFHAIYAWCLICH